MNQKCAHIIVHFTEEYRDHVNPEDFRDQRLLNGLIDRISPEIPSFAILPWQENFNDQLQTDQNLLINNDKVTFCYDNGISGNMVDYRHTPPTLVNTGEELDTHLKALDITHLFFTGYFIDGCVLGHAQDFRRKGFRTNIITDLTNGYSNGKELFVGDGWYEEGYVEGQINARFKAVVSSGIGITTTSRFLEHVKPVPVLPSPKPLFSL